jgi:beta-lactamase regulating signal transducer with metallopeptidase domain
MEPAQVEAILLHELAHIQRSDYLVNFLQTLLETLFFFNPAVWWLSSLIRAEREHCCDDLALAHMTNQMAYLKALVHFEEYRLSTPRQAVAFGGSRGVLTRMERIARGKNRALGKLELAILGFVLLLCTLFIAAAPRNPVSSLLKTPSARSKSPVDRQLEAKRKTEAEAAARSRTNHSP